MDCSGLLTTGQMAQLNKISEKTLRLYQQKGILEPVQINEETGFRYYEVAQCSTIDAIQQLQGLGFSLTEIREAFDKTDYHALASALSSKLEDMRRQQEVLSIAQTCARDLVACCNMKITPPIFEQIMLEQVPPKKIISYDMPPELDVCQRQSDIVSWELTRRAFKQHLLDQGLPSLIFRSAGCIIDQNAVADGSFEATQAFVVLDDGCDHPAANPSQTLPGGQYLTMYSEHVFDADGAMTIRPYLERMLDYAAAKHFKIAGDYYDEVISEGRLFDYNSYDGLLKMYLPVSS